MGEVETLAERITVDDIAEASVAGRDVAADHLFIRGRSLALDALVQLDIDDDKVRADHREAFASNEPFEHLVIDGLFNEDLLRLIEQEFGDDRSGWAGRPTARDFTMRANIGATLGNAAAAYFALLNSKRFVEYLSSLSGTPNLLPDPMLVGGGLHETPPGGYFAVHRDFNVHQQNGLANRLVLITYLNEGWEEGFGGSLELWNKEQCVKSVLPVFGRTIIFKHSDRSFHGHPGPLVPPPGRTRRSVAAYFYENQFGAHATLFRNSSVFLGNEGRFRAQLRSIVKDVLPPAIWRMGAKWRRGYTTGVEY